MTMEEVLALGAQIYAANQPRSDAAGNMILAGIEPAAALHAASRWKLFVEELDLPEEEEEI